MEYHDPNTSYIDKRSPSMAIASLILGIAGLAMSCCIYPAIIFGSLAIILALLSRGGEMTTSGYSKIGLILGIISIVCGILFVQFGGLEGYMQYIEDLMEDMYPNLYDTNEWHSPYDFYNSF